jgi:hypothetical protein
LELVQGETINGKRPEVSVRCVAEILPESSVKPTYKGHCSTDANDPNVWTGCISQLRTCGIAELADMYPAY